MAVKKEKVLGSSISKLLSKYIHEGVVILASSLQENISKIPQGINAVSTFIAMRKSVKKFAVIFMLMIAAVVSVFYGFGVLISYVFPSIFPGLGFMISGIIALLIAWAYMKYF